MQHLDEGTVHAWLDGTLDPAEAARVERHAAECGECAALVAEARGVIAGASRIVASLDGVRGGVIPAATPRISDRSLWRMLHLTPARAALAATLLLAVGSVLTVRRTPRDISKTILQNADHATTATPSPGPPAVTLPGAAAGRTASATRPSATRPSAPAPAPRSAAHHETTAEAPIRAVHVSAPASAPSSPPVSAPAAAPAAGADVVHDSIAPAAAKVSQAPVRDSLAARLAERRAAFGQGTMRLQEVVVTSAEPARGVEGCYALRSESAPRDSALPERFALERPDVVRTVNANAQPDSIIRGATWRQTGPMAALVSFPRAAGPAITLGVSAQNVAARLGTADRRVTAVRADCRP